MRRIGLIPALLLLAATCARADYAVLRSGERLHITGYEQVGDVMRLTVPGGRVDMPVERNRFDRAGRCVPAESHAATGRWPLQRTDPRSSEEAWRG